MKTQFSYQSPEMLDYDGRGMLNYAAWGPPMKQDKDAPSISCRRTAIAQGSR